MTAVVRDPANTATFEDFFEAEHERLFAALWLITRNRHEAEEVKQDAFLKILERWDRVATVENPTGYLYRTAMNLYRSRLRRAAVAIRKSAHMIPADDFVDRIEEREVVVRALALLPPRQRAAVVLVDLFSYPPDEAAVLLGVKTSSVRALTSRGRAKLKDVIGDQDG